MEGLIASRAKAQTCWISVFGLIVQLEPDLGLHLIFRKDSGNVLKPQATGTRMS
jgi:hypothetical protein